MRAGEAQAFESGGERTGMARDNPRQRRHESSYGKADGAVRKKTCDIAVVQAAHGRARGIAVTAVVPEDVPAGPQNAKHLAGNAASHIRIEDRAENGELGNEIETCVAPGETAGIAAAEVGAGQTCVCAVDAFFQKIDAVEVRGLRAPFQEFGEPLTRAAPNIGDGRIGERKRAGVLQKLGADPRGLPLPIPDFRAMPGVEIRRNRAVARLELGADSFDLGFAHGQTASSIRVRKGSPRRRRTGKRRM